MVTHEIIKGIRSRSKLLARQYRFPYEDLFQDGMVHLLTYTKNHPDASFKQIMKSINYKYRDISKKLRTRKRRTISFESLPESFGSYEIEDQIIAKLDEEALEKELKEQGNSESISVLTLANTYGLSLEEAQSLLGLSKDETYIELEKMRSE